MSWVRTKDPPKKPEPSLKVGDPAPALKATKWLQGTEVKSFEKGKIYIVEFWATWCGPCIVMMPHMSEMQEEYKDKSVTFIGYTGQGHRQHRREGGEVRREARAEAEIHLRLCR